MKPVKTASTTTKTASTPEKMMRFGNAGNTKGTTLPKGGCPRPSKMKAGRRY